MTTRRAGIALLVAIALSLAACSANPKPSPAPAETAAMTPDHAQTPSPESAVIRPGAPVLRQGDEIVACGRFFRTGAPVVLWLDPGGYDAYRTTPRFAREPENGFSESARYNTRTEGLSPAELERVRGGGWDLPLLQRTVDQFVIHYDATASARTTFKVLHDDRNLSVHFLLDIDGTIYQTMDLKERAWHATKANSRSVGIEIAHIGARSPDDFASLSEWYTQDSQGLRLTYPPRMDGAGVRTEGFVGRPATPGIHRGAINGSELMQYDYTPEQYESLARLTAALTEIFPLLELRYPTIHGAVPDPNALSDEAFAAHRGLLGHWHVQAGKVDPGPAFDWNKLITRARDIHTQGLKPDNTDARPD